MINSLLEFGAYSLGSAIYIIDQIKRYEDMANANPDPTIVYKKVDFWHKEKWSLLQMFLLGVVSVIILPMLFGGRTIDIKGESGTVLYTVAMKSALIPLQIIVGWTGGKAILAFMGKSKKELYKKVGIEDDK